MSEWFVNYGSGPSDPNAKVIIWFSGDDKPCMGDPEEAREFVWDIRGGKGDIAYYKIVEERDNVNTPSHYDDYLENFRAAMREELSNWRDPKQIDGGHYTDLVIQPLDIAYLNNMDAGRTKVCKYIMRDKNGIQDLRKAKDMVEKIALYTYGEEI